MTKFKEYLRANGVPLACDYEALPCDGVETVLTRVMDNGIEVTHVCINPTDDWHMVFNKRGECIVFRSYEDLPDSFSFCNGPEYKLWLRVMGYIGSERDLEVMEAMYADSATIKPAFKHVKAGIMTEEAFIKLFNKRHRYFDGMMWDF